MDPFEARLKFINLLKNLTPSHQSLTRAAAFAMANAELQEDFVNCILESLEATDLNCRANIFSFIDVLVFQAVADKSYDPQTAYPYIAPLLPKMPQCLELVLPAGPNALINLHSTYVTIKNICKLLAWDCSFWNEQYNARLTDADMERIERKAPFENAINQGKGLDGAWQVLLDRKRQGKYERVWLVKHGEFRREPESEPSLRLTKEQILLRIEADRERNKRAKESLWTVDRLEDGISVAEFRKVYDSHGALNDEDLKELDEINATAEDSYLVAQF
ncbi:hypothetical protein BABINDRAFT_33358 [Babjeviella inositovora NRRL Y-12698]|uniref:CID domain-containing protein n=1 Tax=Babjeviella inositovora NRRL Y-12698 TaxID=984486 RepID=A0A1E3QY29_9ASCO|nr:uncharacterized protein BABINDRAFT_33358 [Babjeviella inositovora NRRL Y-12698]ODQ81967.1 hypothetical protein BABINDRAFT_33358 [Babjeviella inositovora NRRL Y-12698]